MSSAQHTVRRATPADIADCVRIRGLTRENAVSEDRLRSLGITVHSWTRQVEEDSLPGFVCIRDGALAGYCFGDRLTGEVVVLALLPTLEGQGVGRELLNLVVLELSAAGHRRLFLGASSDPAHRSHGFYRHLGWRSTGEVDRNGDEVLEYQLSRE